jgi:signal transduction histidine kinase
VGGHHEVDVGDWSSADRVGLATKLLTEGVTQCLVGTRHLLGEGWDCPPVNCAIDLTGIVAPEIPPVTIGDPTRLRQVLINLAGNALKFTEKGSVDIRVEPLRLGEDRHEFKFSISDTGIGIQKKDIAKLFEPFAQSDGTTTRKYGGTGLGLTISRKIVEMMGGKIDADSTPGQGSTFWFTTCHDAPSTDDPELDEFLAEKQMGGDWSGTQTVAPEDLAVIAALRSGDYE